MIKKAKKFIPFFLIGSLLAEDNGWYMSVGYQIGGTQQFINNKQLLENQNIINSVTQSAINIAGPTTGLITLSSQSVIDALGYGVSNTVGNQLEGISNILNQIGKRKDFYSSRQISSISQQIIGLKGSSDPLKAHSSQITAKLLSNTQSAFDEGIALSSNIISSINSLNPSNNAKEVKAQLQNTAQSMAELLQQIEHSITKTTSTTYAQSLLSNLTDAVNASSNNTAYVSALVNALNTLGVGVFPTTTSTHVVLNPPGQIVFYPTNSILGSTSSNSNNQQQYNNTLLMNTLQGGLTANNQNNPNGCTSQIQCLEQFIQNLAPLAATPTSNNQANQQVQAIAQKLQSVAINTLDNNAINNTTYNLNNLHNALNFQAYQSTIEQYNNALKQISWISFSEPKNLLKNTSNNYQIGTVTNAQGQNISAYDCASATGSLSNDASSGISCSATSSTSNTNSASSFDNSLVATSKVQTINGKEQIGVNSFNLVSQVWSVYNSLKTSEANLQKNANILCTNGTQSGTSSCNNANSGGLSISGNAQLQNILSSTSGTSATAQAKSNASKLKAMVVVNNEEEAKTTNLAQSGGAAIQSPNSTVMGALNAVLQNVSNFQQSIQSAFQNQESNIQAWANAIYNTNGSQSQDMTNNNQDLRIQLRANFYQFINTINQQTPTDMNALINQSQQTQQTSRSASNNNACASGMNGSNSNWCYQQWSDSKAYYSGLQSALGYQTQATTQSGSSGGNSITYNVQQITLTSGGLLNNIISSLKGFNSGGNNGGSSGDGTSQINTAYQMLTDASDGKLGTYNSSSGAGGSDSNNGYTPCNSTNGNNGTSNCYTPNKQQNTTNATTSENNLQKVYNDAQKIANIIASSGNNKGVENGLKQFFEALKNNSSSLSNLCSGNSGSSGSSTTCTGGLINLLGAIPMNGVSDTNNLIHLLTEFIKTAGFIQNNDNSVSTSLTSAFQAITSAISQGFQALQNDISPNAILTLLQEITSNTTTIQSFSQTLRQLLGDKTFFMVQQKLIDAMINARNQVQNAQNQANNYGSQPVLSQYAAAKSTQHGMSNGLGVGIGYKYFFGKARKLGLRHYFFFDYGFSQIGLANQSVKANIFAYGVGTDFLWNLFRRTYNTKALNFGLFAGVQLGGATWLSSLRQQIIDNWGNANDIHSTNFQVALNFGVRTNFAEFKRFAKKFHNQGVISQKSVEFGIKVPLINQAYLNSAGADVSYRRLYTFYINYIMGF
ncbi:Hop family outer membrane protein HopL [Helicobacter pylori]|uniref:Hop family outer membrane protein HopL n=1 Tax=Helicobacter pylori TaxID=210 RepID=UPI0025780A0D|nr:Hop family outer membrane protein HopL [Helicobacter pylori]WJJ00099.1 Hop family outer membrane protein HopL [Helicobacter pylori]WJJ05241.1 Hop family outer membrane protein HopL [Helicobacter pylori]